MHVFIADQWAGYPIETEEMKPEWFEIESIPFDRMWTDDFHWLPHVLAGKFVTATFSFSADERILKKEVSVKSL